MNLKYIIYNCFIALFTIMSLSVSAQNKKSKKNKKNEIVAIDTAKKVVKPKVDPNKKIKPYTTVVNKNFNTKPGLFSVHQHKDSIFFEIPDSILNKDVLVVTRLTKTPAIFNVFPGEQVNELLIQFHKGKDSTIQVRFNKVLTEAKENDNIYKAVEKSTLKPLVASFPILAYSQDSLSSVIDLSKYLKELNFINALPTSYNKNLTTASIINPRVENIRVYPKNVEITIGKSYNQSSTDVVQGEKLISLETNTSFILLPDVPMQRRYFDKRVGYFARGFYQYGDDQHKMEVKNFIARWRLEPKAEDIDKYKKGILVEPKKPIEIYIDPATPKQWVPYLIAGINDWQKSFEKAGFKNAIIGKEWPENDPNMHLDDVRISMINYFPSPVSNAYGPHLADPRSGEIIQTRIGWYHNIMDILNKWYFIQAAATDPQARKPKFDDKLMGELIRFVSSHEVGHTLGLRHNFGSSSKTPVESLRDINYLKKNGHTASIMDYARFNYVAQPEDNIPQELLFPRIGDYDDWAIEWGYKHTYSQSAEEDAKIVKQWIVERVKANPRLWFGDGESKSGDPRNQIEDLGDNNMKASTYGIKNLKRVIPNILKWSYTTGGDFTNAAGLYNAAINQYYMYINHALNNVGGIYRTYSNEDDIQPIFKPTPKNIQLEAISFLDRELFNTPHYLLNKTLIDKLYDPVFKNENNKTSYNFVQDLQIKGINTLLTEQMLGLVIANYNRFGKGTYSIEDHFNAIRKSIWKELNSKDINLDMYRRNLQKSYITSLITNLTNPSAEISETDIALYSKIELIKVRNLIKANKSKAQNSLTNLHLDDILTRIENALNPKK